MPEQIIKSTETDRRGFLWIMGGLLLGTFVATANAVVRYLMPPPKQKLAKELRIPTAQIPLGSSLVVEYKGSPVILVNSGGGVSAYSAVCTHLGCLVKWVSGEKIFYCPCHAGKFDLSGKVIAGPAPEPLHKIDIEVTDGIITFI
jgi:cytochrome b6-f complex iron-sulfur subunit